MTFTCDSGVILSREIGWKSLLGSCGLAIHLTNLNEHVMNTHSIHSIAMIMPKSCNGRLTAWRTIMIMIPDPGIPAAPMEAAIAIKLQKKNLKKMLLAKFQVLLLKYFS